MELSPAVVIATRKKLVAELARFGGKPIPERTRAEIVDAWIGAGYFADQVYAGPSKVGYAGASKVEPKP